MRSGRARMYAAIGKWGPATGRKNTHADYAHTHTYAHTQTHTHTLTHTHTDADTHTRMHTHTHTHTPTNHHASSLPYRPHLNGFFRRIGGRDSSPGKTPVRWRPTCSKLADSGPDRGAGASSSSSGCWEPTPQGCRWQGIGTGRRKAVPRRQRPVACAPTPAPGGQRTLRPSDCPESLPSWRPSGRHAPRRPSPSRRWDLLRAP